MSLGTLSAHDRRVAILGAAAIVVLILALRGIPSWRSWQRESRSATTEQANALSRDAALLEGFPAAVDSLEGRIARLRHFSPSVLSAPSVAEAASDLAAMVATIARESSVRLEGANVGVDSSRNRALPRATVDVQATADVAGLSDMLARVERGTVLANIRQIRIRPTDVASPSSQPELLTVRLVIEAPVVVQRGTSRDGS